MYLLSWIRIFYVNRKDCYMLPKRFLASLLIVAICSTHFCGCYHIANNISTGDITQTNEDQYNSHVITEDVTSNRNEDIDFNKIIEIIPNRIDNMVEANGFILHYNCKVDKPVNSISNLRTIKLVPSKVDSDFLTSLSEVFFNDLTTINYDKNSGLYTMKTEISDGEYYTLMGCEMVYSITGHKKNLCFWESNRCFTDIKDIIDVEDAIMLCNNFINETGLFQYKFNNIVTYGKEVGELFHILNYTLDINDITINNTHPSNIEFYVTNEGIYTIKGCVFEVLYGTTIDNIISFDDTLNILKKKICNSSLYADYTNPFNYVVDENGLIKYFEIYKIALEYVCISASDTAYIMVPAWRFYFGTNGNIDYNRVLAIDIVNGELITS